jgi:cytochrome P450
VPSYVEIQSLQYLRCEIRETQRLVPIVATIERSAVRDTWLRSGGGDDLRSPIFVLKGQQVQVQIYAMHGSKALWGEDADEFKPERWTDLKPGWEVCAVWWREKDLSWL